MTSIQKSIDHLGGNFSLYHMENSSAGKEEDENLLRFVNKYFNLLGLEWGRLPLIKNLPAHNVEVIRLDNKQNYHMLVSYIWSENLAKKESEKKKTLDLIIKKGDFERYFQNIFLARHLVQGFSLPEKFALLHSQGEGSFLICSSNTQKKYLLVSLQQGKIVEREFDQENCLSLIRDPYFVLCAEERIVAMKEGITQGTELEKKAIEMMKKEPGRYILQFCEQSMSCVKTEYSLTGQKYQWVIPHWELGQVLQDKKRIKKQELI